MQRNIILSLIPLLTSAIVVAEPSEKVKLTSPISRADASGNAWRASEVIGQNVKNAEGETIGEVEDLLVDMKSGEIQAVVVAAGGFLGIGDELTAVPVSSLRFDTTTKAFKTSLTKEQLGKAPQFKANAWPDYSNAATMATMRSYRDSIGGDVTAADNTAQNEKTENREVMIPTDQGNSEMDIEITKNIRTSIIATDMSFNAKNIKIITKDERVVLKGVVGSAAEHQAILKIAKDHAKSTMITDELKVADK